MILRPYQKRLVSRAKTALEKKGNTLCIGPTGCGKTIILSALAREIGGRQCILQHRDELVAQNLAKFQKVAPQRSVGLFTAGVKTWRGDTTFAMVQTLSRPNNLKTIPPLDLLVIDEAHHSAAASYRNVLDAVKGRNPDCKIAGFTATPNRGDKRGLRAAFDNVADQISMKELVDLGFLVPPKAFVIDVGVKEDLGRVRKLASDYDMAEVEAIMNRQVINDEVVKHWREKAGDRRTIVFCSTVAHAEDVTKAFRADGITTEMVTGETTDGMRKAILRRLDQGEVQVVVNVAVLTEGFDSPPVSCVILLRPCSFKSTMIQMIGRGLRVVNPREYPGIVKKDCIVLDFGTSILTHGDLESLVDLDGREPGETEGSAPFKVCPAELFENGLYRVPDPNGRFGCGAEVPAGVKTCPLCGFEFKRLVDDLELDEVELTEIDILNKSPFKWVDLFGSGKVLVACGFEGVAVIATRDGETWFALGRLRKHPGLQTLALGGEVQAQAAADDFLREHESENTAHKSKRWLRDPATEKQRALLTRAGYEVGPLGMQFTKYTANAHLNFQWNRRAIEQAVFAA